MPPTVDKEICIGCGVCIETCPVNVLELSGDIVIVARPDDCVECGICEDTCPTDAIKP